MNVRRLWVFLAVSYMARFAAPGVSTNYVDSAGTNPVPPFSTWATAARTLQDAVTVAQDGNVVLVSNGIYVVTNPVTSTSVGAA